VVAGRGGDNDRVSIGYNASQVYGEFKAISWSDRGTEYDVKLEHVTPELARQILALVAASRV
jgi:hypothetical protein